MSWRIAMTNAFTWLGKLLFSSASVYCKNLWCIIVYREPKRLRTTGLKGLFFIFCIIGISLIYDLPLNKYLLLHLHFWIRFILIIIICPLFSTIPYYFSVWGLIIIYDYRYLLLFLFQFILVYLIVLKKIILNSSKFHFILLTIHYNWLLLTGTVLSFHWFFKERLVSSGMIPLYFAIIWFPFLLSVSFLFFLYAEFYFHYCN